jgi:CRISPR/Cas system CSM-associated protein Csm5 (group 7 of RAMP superfamily)
LIGNNFKNIYENTESLIFSIRENDKKYAEEFKAVREVQGSLMETKGDVQTMGVKMDEMQKQMESLVGMYQGLVNNKR